MLGGVERTEQAIERVQQLDAGLRAAAQADARFSHALAYGSFPQGRADRYSDLEYWFFLEDGAGAGDEQARDWLAQTLPTLSAAGPVLEVLDNEFGAAVAILPGLLRVELHVATRERLTEVLSWDPGDLVPERMVVKDQCGELRALLERAAARTQPAPDPGGELGRLLNWLTLGLNVLIRF